MFRRSVRPLALAAAVLLAVSAPHAAEAPARVERGNLVLEGIPDAPAPVKDRLVQYNNVRSAAFHGFTPDGHVLITTRFGETAQVHEVAMPLGARQQLTFYGEPIASVGIRPDGSGTLVLRKDTGGDEFFQGYLRAPGSGVVTLFTEPGTRNESLTWTRDGRTAAWSVARSGKTEREVVVGDPSSPTDRSVVYTGPSGVGPIAWSPDQEYLLMGEYVSVTRSTRFLLELATQKVIGIPGVTTGGDVAYEGGAFTADGTAVYLITDGGQDRMRLVRVDLATGALAVIAEDPRWDIETFTLSKDGRTLAYSVNAGGVSQLHLFDTTKWRELSAPTLPSGVIGSLGFSEDGTRLGLSLGTPTIPGDVWVYELKRRLLTRWTDSELGGLDRTKLVEPTLVETKGFDGLPLPAWLYTPKGATKAPVIVQIHGGPEGQSRPTFSPSIQYWVNELGVAVLVPNVRGSTGYGRRYVSLDNGMLREDSVKDIGSWLDWIATQPTLDASRVISYGGSYGGYMSLACLTHYSDRLAGGVDIVGISSFVTFLNNTQGYRRDLRRAEYGDERDPAMRTHLDAISPLTNAAKITKPLFVIQGFNDPRVPWTEAEQIAAKVREQGVPVWYLMAKDEGHGFAKKSNRDFQREAETMFLAQVFGLKVE